MKNYLEYKGYVGSAELDTESKVMVGKLKFIKDVIAYSGESFAELEQSFRDAVDDYLATCLELGDEPEVPCKGSFNVRVGPERHKEIAVEALRQGVKLNELVCHAIDSYIGKTSLVEHRHQHNHQHSVQADVVVRSVTTSQSLERVDGDWHVPSTEAKSSATKH